MTYNLKKDHVKNWDLLHANEKPVVHIVHDDDQDTYISERSSVASSNDMNPVFTPLVKRLPTPTISSVLPVPQKQPHTLRYHYNELPENGVAIGTQFQLQHKEEKNKKTNLRKAPPGQGALLSLPETKTPELSDNHYPYWYYYKTKNPDWIMHHRQIADGQIAPYESLDPSQHTHQPALITSPIKPRQQPRKARYNHVPIIPSNQDKQRLDQVENNSLLPMHLTTHENHENNNQKQRPSPRQYISVKDSDHDEHRIQPTKRITPQQRRKLKTENDWTDNYLQSVSNGKSSQNSNDLIITSNSMANRSKNRPKIPDKNSLIPDVDENGKHRPHYSYHHQNQTQPHNSPSIPSQHPHHLQQHLPVRRRPPSGAYLSSEFQVVDVSFKKSERSPYFQQPRDLFHSPVLPIYNQSPYLPPIIRDHQQHKTITPRFPTEYYGTLARQAHGKDWEESLDIPKIYKAESQTRFYDRYINNVVDKRLAA